MQAVFVSAVHVTIAHMRRTRYRRQPTGLPHRLTGRDVEILSTIDRFHFLTSQQIADLLVTSRQATNKRLKLLFNHHYLGKLPAHLSPRLFNSPDVYFVDLDRRTAKVLRDHGVPLPFSKRHLPKREHLQHTLLANDILIAFELAARRNPRIQFLGSNDLLTGTKRQGHAHPWKVPAFLPEHGSACASTRRHVTRHAYPDAAFALLDRKTDKRQLYLIEADRMTQPLTRSGKSLFRVSNIKGKILLYHTAWKQGAFRKRFEIPATRILFVTLSAARARHMRELASGVLAGSAPGLFVFTDKDSLAPGAAIWSREFGL